MNRGEHSQAEAVDFQDSEGVDVVLVPFDEGAPGHRTVLERNHLAEGASCDHEATDVL